jgi:hypothetical protein
MTASEACMTCNGVDINKDHIKQCKTVLSRQREGEERELYSLVT